MRNCFFVIIFLVFSFSQLFSAENNILSNKGGNETEKLSFIQKDHIKIKLLADNKSDKGAKTLRNTGIGLFVTSMVFFQIALIVDIVAIVMGEFDILYPELDWYTVAFTRNVLWAILGISAFMWLIFFIPGVVFMARGAYLIKKGKKSRVSYKQWYIKDESTIASALVFSL